MKIKTPFKDLIKNKHELTAEEKRKMQEMIELFGGEGNVDKSKVRKRILAQRKRKTNRVTSRDMEDMLGY